MQVSWIPDVQCCFKKHHWHHVFSLTCMPCFCICEWGSILESTGCISSTEAFYSFIIHFFYVWILVTICFNCLGDNCKPFPLKIPTVFCKLKNFTHPSICMSVSRWWLNFHFWVNCPFNIFITLVLSVSISVAGFLCCLGSHEVLSGVLGFLWCLG